MIRFAKELLLVAIVLSACAQRAKDNVIPEDVLQIRVMAGTVSLNGTPIDMEFLEAMLQDAEATNKQVWYYRDNPAGEPSAEALEVLTKIASHNVPVSMSSKQDFSDAIDENGNSRPRDIQHAD